jgi:methylenetetrahydrofolate dehydrogenase (NADP+) / methenyltetrahydrofolate cyclohydrolase
METRILKGETVRDRIFAEVGEDIFRLQQQSGARPGIVFIGFEGVPLGKYNMPLHVTAATRLGFRVRSELMPAGVKEGKLSEVLAYYNRDPETDAIVLLQPLPMQLNPLVMAGKVDQQKEVEGFHPLNLAGTLMPDFGLNRHPMCLPAALVEIFGENSIVPGPGEEWLFLVDDEFLVNPLTRMIVKAAAAAAVPAAAPIAFVAKSSQVAPVYCRRADYLVVVSKCPEYLDPSWLKPGVCIIDIYSNLVREVPSKADPAQLVPVIRGGVNVNSVLGIAASILPVPGGLMTAVLGILFRNALNSFRTRKETGLPARITENVH